MRTPRQLFTELYTRRARGIEPGLDVIRALLEELGNPHRRLPCIHIAGTNGKGSVAAMLSSCLTRAGYRTGLYTSPHLVHFTERFRVDETDIGEDELADGVRRVLDAESRLGGQLARKATFFELSTAAAFLLFHDRGIQLAVIETGLGGTWDATNVMVPLVSVITPVSLDHGRFLGDSLESVAGEKCGIIKRGRPVVAARQVPEVREIIGAACREREAPMIAADETVSVRSLRESLDGQRLKIESLADHYRPVRFPLAGRIQCANVSAAVAALESLDQYCGVQVFPDAVAAGLEAVRWPGRFDHVCAEPDIVVDGAHNPAGVEVLTDWLQRAAAHREIRCIAGFLAEKDISTCLRRLASKVRKGWAVTADDPRAARAEDIAAAASAQRIELKPCSWEHAADEGVAWAKQSGGLLLICGSLYLAGRALEHFSNSDAGR